MRDSKENIKGENKPINKIGYPPKTLSLELKKNGFRYTQYLRHEKGFIYAQWYNGRIIAYEVFKYKISPEKTIKGKKIHSTEWFPPNEAFGRWAWTFNSLELAILCFCEITGLNKKEVEQLINK